MTRRVLTFVTATFVALGLCASNAGATTIINFDNLTPGDVVTNIGGVTFSVDDPLAPSYGANLVVLTGLPTSSPENYLGTDRTGGFSPGDILNLVFPDFISFLDVTFIGPYDSQSDPANPAFALQTGSFTVDSASVTPFPVCLIGDPSCPNPNSDVGFTLHLAPGTPFNTASIIGLPGAPTGFNVDDITFESANVPEPGTVALMLGPLFGLVRYRRSVFGRR